MTERAVNGDFHVIRMDGLFHVVFRPDGDPEWFRIIASFYTYERAYSYCDIERVTAFEDWDEREDYNAETAVEEHDGLRLPPVALALPTGGLAASDGVAELVRGIYDGGEHVEPHPIEDFSDHPQEDEGPKDYHDRLYRETLEREAAKPTCQNCGKPRSVGSAALCRDCFQGKVPAEDTPQLTDKQRAVLEYFLEHANPMRLVSASYKQIATEARVSNGSIVYLVETLERKGFIEIVEKAKGSARSSVFKLVPDKIIASAEEGKP